MRKETETGGLIDRAKLITEIEKAQESLKVSDPMMSKINQRYRKGLAYALNLTVKAPSVIETEATQLICRYWLIEHIESVQNDLQSNNDKKWEKNKPYYKGLAWARRLVLDTPSVCYKCEEGDQ